MNILVTGAAGFFGSHLMIVWHEQHIRGREAHQNDLSS
jgi:nucleoside-diphosphate-sugar epimerase